MRAIRLLASILVTRPAPLRVTLPLAASFIIAAAALTAMAWFSAQREDEAEAQSERLIVGSLLERLHSDLGHTLSAYANWNEAYEKVREPLDRPWIADNYGTATIGVQGVDGAYIFDAEGRCLFAVSDRVDRGFDVKAIDPAIKALAARVRATHKPDWKDYERGMISRGGRALILSATFITPSQDSLYGATDPGRILVFERAIDAAQTQELGRKFNIQNLDQTVGPGDENLAFFNPLGQPAGQFSWLPQRPGSRALMKLLPAAGLVLLILAIANAYVLGTWLAMQDAMTRAGAAATAAEAASRTKSVLLAHLSHELRTPLNAIIGFSSLIGAEADEPAALTRCRDYAQHIHKGGNDLLSLVNKLLELARIDRGEKEIELAAASGSEILAFAEDAVGRQAAAAGLSFRTNAETPLPDVLCDISATQQILQHLLDNALKFTPRGGEVILSARASGDKASVVFTVCDTGVGIDPERLAGLGAAFTMGDEAYSRRHGGIGLGLAIARHLAELQNGRLDLDSAQGQGTRAALSLTAAVSKSARRAA